MEWWAGLNLITQIFFAAAVFFGILFLWQLLASVLGIGGDHGFDHDVSHDFSHDVSHEISHDAAHGSQQSPSLAETTGDHTASPAHAHEHPGPTFRLLTVRSVLAFFTLFTWVGFVSLLTKSHAGPFETFLAIAFALIWGVAGLLVVAIAFYLLLRLTETGTSRIDTCVGSHATVYMDIPESGWGQVRCTVSGAVTCIKARGAGGQAIKAGTPVLVLYSIDATSVEVQPLPEI
jgi:hypothetical protein